MAENTMGLSSGPTKPDLASATRRDGEGNGGGTTDGTRSVGFDAIETASVDELRALQLARLKQSLRLAYDKMPVYRARCEARIPTIVAANEFHLMH